MNLLVLIDKTLHRTELFFPTSQREKEQVKLRLKNITMSRYATVSSRHHYLL